MFYLTTHSTHFIYGYVVSDIWLRTILIVRGRKKVFYLTTYSIHLCGIRHMVRERNVLFNDALNTFYLWLYGIIHMVKEHSDSEKGNPLPPHNYFFRLTARVLLYAQSHRQDSTYTGFVTPVVEDWLEQETAQCVHPMKD